MAMRTIRRAPKRDLDLDLDFEASAEDAIGFDRQVVLEQAVYAELSALARTTPGNVPRRLPSARPRRPSFLNDAPARRGRAPSIRRRPAPLASTGPLHRSILNAMLVLRRAVAVLVAVLLATGFAIGGSLLEQSRADAAPLRRTTTALSSSVSPSAPGATVTFTAVVLRKGFLTPDPTSGTVTFFDGPNVMGTGTVGANHAATFATAALTPGSHSILARFEGTVSYRASWSDAITQVVDAPIATTTSVASSLSPAQFTQSVTLTATVTASTGSARRKRRVRGQRHDHRGL